jgi:hypothetical protein
MKSYLSYALLTGVLCGLVSSCYQAEEDEISTDAVRTITVDVAQDVWDELTSRAAAEQVTPTLPVHYYLYSKSTEQFVADTEITSGTDLGATFDVAKGKYTVYALTGVSCPLTFKEASLDSLFTFAPDADICLGSTSVSVSSSNVTGKITAAHVFSQLSLSVQDVPDDVTAMTATISSVYNSFGWDGKHGSTTGPVTLTLTKSAGATTWSTEHYTYPSTSALKITLTATRGQNTETVSTTSKNWLTIGRKLNLSATYQTLYSAGVTIVTDKWTSTDEELVWDTTEENTPSVGDTPSVDDSTSSDTVESEYVFGTQYESVRAIVVGTTEEGLLILGVRALDRTADLSTYSTFVGGNYSWGMPTKAQWDIVREKCGNDFVTFNEALSSISGASAASSAYCYQVKNSSSDSSVRYYRFNSDGYSDDNDERETRFYPVAIVPLQ